jgi:hypothetical protein
MKKHKTQSKQRETSIIQHGNPVFNNTISAAASAYLLRRG